MPDTDVDVDVNPSPLPISAYAPLISLLAPFTRPPPPSGTTAATALTAALTSLWHEHQQLTTRTNDDNDGDHDRDHDDDDHDNTNTVLSLELHQKLRIFNQLLTIRNAKTPLPATTCNGVETTIQYLSTKKVPTTVSAIQRISQLLPLPLNNNLPLHKVSLWRGDITTLNATAIVNAANEQMLGCFTPDHLCIDNVIHAAAGPRLREDCNTIIDAQGFLEPTGNAKVTRGYCLPAKYVLHTVGPMVPGRSPGEPRVKEFEKARLRGCYKSCLEAMEELPDEADGKTITFCCISTGVFGYPADEAVHIAVDTVLEYFTQNPTSSVDKVIFNVFTAIDFTLYVEKFNTLVTTALSASDFTIPLATTPTQSAISLATTWLSSCNALLITAGAGLSASDGLDYTSVELFQCHFPGMWERGFRSLYDLFGYDDWRSPCDKWGYYFSHLIFARSWEPPRGKETSVYTRLKTLLDHEQKPYFIRTSNADCLFLRNGFPSTQISTPQGSYELLQCMAKCRFDAVFNVQSFIDAALPYLDLRACQIKDDLDGWETAIPHCPFCHGEMFLCVRGGNYFNEAPFAAANRRYNEFVTRWMERGDSGGGELVVLELGAGFNTPVVIRQPNEKLVETGRGRVKLVRVGMEGSEMVDWSVEGVDAVGIEGDAGVVIEALMKGLGI